MISLKFVKVDASGFHTLNNEFVAALAIRGLGVGGFSNFDGRLRLSLPFVEARFLAFVFGETPIAIPKALRVHL